MKPNTLSSSHDIPAVLVSPYLSDADELCGLEQEFAYIHAESVIERECNVVAVDGLMHYYDLRSAELDITDEVRYLTSRRLLESHPKHPHWVSIRDEGEPLPETAGA